MVGEPDGQVGGHDREAGQDGQGWRQGDQGRPEARGAHTGEAGQAGRHGQREAPREGPPGHAAAGAGAVRVGLRPAWLGVIVVGGAAGTSLRAALEGAFGAGPGEWPWVTFWINLGGAFMLGALLEGLAGSSLGRTWRRGLQLGLGTGLLGGFTTYSTFSLETVQLLDSGHWPIGLGYALAAVTGGVAAAAGGIAAVRRLGSLRAGGAR